MNGFHSRVFATTLSAFNSGQIAGGPNASAAVKAVFFSPERMSIKLMQMVWENAPCRENSLLILLALADWANDDGVCWPSMQKLADKARVDRRSAQRIVRKLVIDNLVVIDEGGGRTRQHRYTVQTAALCRPPTGKGDFPDIKTATLATERATFPTERATPVSPDPLVDPSEEPSIEPPYGGDRFKTALASFERHRARMKKPLTEDAKRLLYVKLSKWDEATACEALEDAVINRWQGVFEPRRNGYVQQSEAPTVARANGDRAAWEAEQRKKMGWPEFK